ncbi:MAG TPA: toll/interleukin-1 receptor domain-containing protein [Anaerolineales bacterium]|nr:toll/interleukin-1 receptor domain-containing protein [Anaerolineales bacterium]
MPTEKQRLTFISYSRADKEFALGLARELRSSGFLIWLDQLDIPTGSRWDDEVEKALDQCEIFMVIMTPRSIVSNNVKDEIGYAIDSNKRIMPVLLENAVLPFRLRRFQYVDFTCKTYEEGIEAAKQLLHSLLNEPAAPAPLTSSQAVSPKAKPPEPDSIEQQRVKALQHARELERLERQAQAASSRPATNRTVLENQAQGKSLAKNFPMLLGIGLLSIVCLLAAWIIWPYLPIHPISTGTPTEEVVIQPPPLVTTTLLPAMPTSSSTSTAIVEATFTSTNTQAPTVTPFAPQEPEQFIFFFYETILYKRDYELAWSLLTEKFKAKNNPEGFENWKAVWESVVEWERPHLTTQEIRPGIILLTTPEIWFQSSKWYSLTNRRFCLIRDKDRNTWMMESISVCGQ